MRVYNENTQKEKNMRFTGTVKQLLAKLKINRETVIVLVDNTPVTADKKLKQSDEVKILSVVSGG